MRENEHALHHKRKSSHKKGQPKEVDGDGNLVESESESEGDDLYGSLMAGKDILDLAISQRIRLHLHDGIKASDYVVGMCGTEKDSFLKYKKKNFLNLKEKI